MGYSSWGCKESDTTEQLSTDSKTQEKQLEMGDHRLCGPKSHALLLTDHVALYLAFILSLGSFIQ